MCRSPESSAGAPRPSWPTKGTPTPRPDYAQQIPVRVIAHVLGVPPTCPTPSPNGSGTSSSSPTIHESRRHGIRTSLQYFVAQSPGAGTTPATTCSGSCCRPRSTGHPSRRRRAGHRRAALSLASTRPGAPSARRSGTWPPIPKTASVSPASRRSCPSRSRSCCGPTRRSPWLGWSPRTSSTRAARCGPATRSS